MLIDQPKSSCLLLLPWCTAFTGYHTYKQKNQLQPMAGYWQTRNSLPGTSPSRREKTTINGRHSWQFKYIHPILIVLYMSNGLICAYITGIHNIRIVMSCTMWYLPQSTGVFRLLSSILSADNFAIIYVCCW